MAIYHLHMQTISRSDGRSAVAAAAYRSASRLIDQHGTVFDYRRKAGVEQGHIIVPQGFPAIDRQALWCMAEVTEKRKNSTLCRELDVALPIECDRKEQREIVNQYCSWIAKKWQVAVDFNLHYPMNTNNPENPHAHIQFTTRRYGFDGKLSEKTRELDDLKTRTDCLLEIREQWATLCNQHLSRHGTSIDHRSYATQGIEQLPGIHLGPSVTAMKRKGIRTDRSGEQQQIERVNCARKKILEEEVYVRSRLAKLGEAVCETDATGGIRPYVDADQFGDAGNFNGNLGSKDAYPSDGDGGRTTEQGRRGNDQPSGGVGGGSHQAEVGNQDKICEAEVNATVKCISSTLSEIKRSMLHRVEMSNTALMRRKCVHRSITRASQEIHTTCRQIKNNIYRKVDYRNEQYLTKQVERLQPQRLHVSDGYIESINTALSIQSELRHIAQHIHALVDAVNMRAIVGQDDNKDGDTQSSLRM